MLLPPALDLWQTRCWRTGTQRIFVIWQKWAERKTLGASQRGEGSELRVLTQTQKPLSPPITSPSSKKTPLAAQGRMWMSLHLAPILPNQPLPLDAGLPCQDRRYLAHTGKKKPVKQALQGQPPRGNEIFFQYSREYPATFYVIKKMTHFTFWILTQEILVYPLNGRELSFLKVELTLCHKPQDRYYTLRFSTQVKAGRQCFH